MLAVYWNNHSLKLEITSGYTMTVLQDKTPFTFTIHLLIVKFPNAMYKLACASVLFTLNEKNQFSCLGTYLKLATQLAQPSQIL